jgi:hypothetical protein
MRAWHRQENMQINVTKQSIENSSLEEKVFSDALLLTKKEGRERKEKEAKGKKGGKKEERQ